MDCRMCPPVQPQCDSLHLVKPRPFGYNAVGRVVSLAATSRKYVQNVVEPPQIAHVRQQPTRTTTQSCFVSDRRPKRIRRTPLVLSRHFLMYKHLHKVSPQWNAPHTITSTASKADDHLALSILDTISNIKLLPKDSTTQHNGRSVQYPSDSPQTSRPRFLSNFPISICAPNRC